VVTSTATWTSDPGEHYWLKNVKSSFRIPVYLPSLCVRRGRSIAEVTSVSSDLAGLIVLLSSIASRGSIEFVNGSIARAPDGKVVVSLFVDYTDSGLSAEGLANSLGGIGVVEGLSVNGYLTGGVTINKHLFPLLLGGNRAVAFSVEVLGGMIDHLRERLGEAANTLLYDLGRQYGVLFTRQVREETGLTFDELAQISLAELQAAGWCVVEGYSGDPVKRFWRIIVKDLFECAKRRSGSNNSHFFRGVVSGMLGEAYGSQDVSCIETLCAGNSTNSCEFAAWV